MAVTRVATKAFVLSLLSDRLTRPRANLNESDNLRRDLLFNDRSLVQFSTVLNKRHWNDVHINPLEIVRCRTVRDLIELTFLKAKAQELAAKIVARRFNFLVAKRFKESRDAVRPKPSTGTRLAKPKRSSKSSARKKKKATAHTRPKRSSGTSSGKAKPSSKKKLASKLPRKKAELDKCEYQVWYGTNRKPNNIRDMSKGYSADRDAQIHYGFCRVYVPKSHKIGSIGSPWWKRLITRADDRLKIIAISELDPDAFWQRINTYLAKIRANERHAVIFVHGYNVSFNDAAIRAAQIGFDLSIKGAMAFFSWPSQARLNGYLADEATIEASELQIADFMAEFATKSGAEAVHIIAHSMGNRGVLRAVNRIAEQAERRTGIPFGQVILAAADVDADTFRQLCVAYPRVAQRTTMYVSTRDRAVEASEWLHDYARVGLMPPIFIAPGIDTINVTNADLTRLGHGYVGEARDVLHDIHELIIHGAPPNDRFGLREERTDTGDSFWVIGA